jgi:hypothetical protein
VISAGRSWAWIYWRCVPWGLATGAGAGAGFGALVAGTSYLGPASAFPGALAGAFYGAIFAVIPTLLAGGAVAQFLWERQSKADVRRDIGTVFGAVAFVINAAAVVAIALSWNPYAVLALLAGDAGGLPMLWWGRSSMVKAWVREPAGRPT